MRLTTIVTVHYNTPTLLRRLYESVRRYYERVPFIVVDGASGSESDAVLEMIEAHERSRVLRQNSNVGHGPGMDIGIRAARSPFVLTMDTDCEIIAPGIIGAMLDCLASNWDVYVVGREVLVNACGGNGGHIPYVHPATALWCRELYINFSPFEHHGAPCLRNVLEAQQDGWLLQHLDVERWVTHLGGGTRAAHGSQAVSREEIQ